MPSENQKFCLDLPKIELHAHLTGSIRPETLQSVWKAMRLKDPNLDLGDPVEVLEEAGKTMDAVTFFPLFSKYIYRLCNSAEYITQCTRAVLADFAADGVSYLELRTIPRPALDLSADAYVSLVLDVIATQPATQRPALTYLILGVDRKNTAAEAMAVVDLAIKYQARGVVGVDLAGNPAKGMDLVQQHAEAYAKAKKARLGVTLHFAEIEQSSSNEELKALLDYAPDRLGHVIRVPEWAKKVIQERKIGLELCLSCNVKAKLIEGGYAQHHFGEWWGKGCPIAICTDDVGIFGSKNSQEWELLMEHFKLDKREAIKVCRSGIDGVFGTEADKQKIRNMLDDFEATAFT